MLTAASSGFALGFSLILAIGAQNAFVLRQGLRGSHVLLICLACAISDAILIIAGVAGFSAIVSQWPALVPIARWGGAAFLMVYGAMSFRAAFGTAEHLDPAAIEDGNWAKALLTCLALTWLNPHVYLDTVILLGSVSTQYPGKEFWFGFGAASASFVFFFSLGYGARVLRPFFAKPSAWRILEFLIGLIMWAIAAGLILKV